MLYLALVRCYALPDGPDGEFTVLLVDLCVGQAMGTYLGGRVGRARAGWDRWHCTCLVKSGSVWRQLADHALGVLMMSGVGCPAYSAWDAGRSTMRTSCLRPSARSPRLCTWRLQTTSCGLTSLSPCRQAMGPTRHLCLPTVLPANQHAGKWISNSGQQICQFEKPTQVFFTKINGHIQYI